MAEVPTSVAQLLIDRTNLTLADRVETLLREQIVLGEHPQGARLSEGDIARSFGVSRGPVREALRRLVHDGLVTVEPHRGAFVRTLELAEVQELFEVRIALESQAAALAAERIDAEGVAELRALAHTARDEVHRNGRSGAFDTYDLHDLVVRLAGNQRLTRSVAQVNTELRLARSWSGATGSRASEAVREHDRLVSALAARDPRGAREAMRNHLVAALRNTVTLLRPTVTDGRNG